MSSSILKAVKFVSSDDDKAFGIAIKKRVATYFKEKKIAKTGDYRIWIKVIMVPLMYLTPFGFLLTNSFSGNLLLFYGLWLLMGVGLAGCGMGVMHDACHGALSKKRWVNDFIGNAILNLAGGHALNWKIQHNVLHHSYTNINGYDEDIDPSGVMRFSPHQPLKSMFKYQVFYAWFLYGLMTFSWATFKDFLQMYRYAKKGLLAAQGTTFKKEFPKLIIEKILYHLVFIVLPILLINVQWYHVLLGWFAMHFLAGFILAIVFQPAHVVPSSDFPLPNKENNLKGDWAIHQMETTADFAPSNRILSWYVGGLNYQIEHHLFPTMCHVHYRGISKIVESTAKEFNVPYHSEPTFIDALVKHVKMLHKLGR